MAFSTSTFCAGATWRRKNKVERGCTTTNLRLSNGIESVSIFKRLDGEVVSTNYAVQRRDWQTKQEGQHPLTGQSGGQKPQFWANFDLWGLLYRPPFTDEGKIWCAIADPWYTLMCQISSRSVYSVAVYMLANPLPIFAIFWTSTSSGVANWQQSEKVEHRCTTINLPLSKGIKIVSVLQ